MTQFTKQQIVDKITTSDVWLLRAFNKLIDDELVLDHDKLWFNAIKSRSKVDMPDNVKNIVRFKLISSYIDEILDFANGG